MKKNFWKKQQGFTLLEMLIAVGMFTMVMVVATSMFLRSVDSQARAMTSKNIQEDLNFTMSVMTNEMSKAKLDLSACGSPCDKMGTRFFCVLDSGATLQFVVPDENDPNIDRCVTYKLDPDIARGVITVDKSGVTDYLTSKDVSISSLNFYNLYLDDVNPISRVTVFIKGQSLDTENHPDSVSLQTTVATRYEP